MLFIVDQDTNILSIYYKIQIDVTSNLMSLGIGLLLVSCAEAASNTAKVK